jgi:hypothetical protein
MYFFLYLLLALPSAAACDADIPYPNGWRRQAEVRLDLATYAIDLLKQVEDVDSDVGLL